ncbi:hypothetical protein GRI38_02460 [Altererythrobacter aurantiacus]|uniref:Abasic site processing protein n=1 Tax=Parapontixanthobacter aurantiacus TaxID=1463599 RepID=A0A844ZD08_9SPHN|nr:SOS response-associated peptidase family protein [Parapontixanthobacter aurantiacus]MXO84897.1 hypothetical protein [Parapontixanthobacter aurantiacus]
MCNLYRMAQSVGEVAEWFRAVDRAGGANLGSEVYPGYPGLVVASGEVQAMHWGFPLERKNAKGEALKPKPVNNTRTDKLDSFFWRKSFVKRRCLIPLSAWAEAEGKKGAMTRTWLSLPDTPLFAVAGIWDESPQWGRVYSMVMTDASGDAADVHSRMPVVLEPASYELWTAGPPDAAMELCAPYAGKLTIDRTDEPWSGHARQASLF